MQHSQHWAEICNSAQLLVIEPTSSTKNSDTIPVFIIHSTIQQFSRRIIYHSQWKDFPLYTCDLKARVAFYYSSIILDVRRSRTNHTIINWLDSSLCDARHRDMRPAARVCHCSCWLRTPPPHTPLPCRIHALGSLLAPPQSYCLLQGPPFNSKGPINALHSSEVLHSEASLTCRWGGGIEITQVVVCFCDLYPMMSSKH